MGLGDLAIAQILGVVLEGVVSGKVRPENTVWLIRRTAPTIYVLLHLRREVAGGPRLRARRFPLCVSTLQCKEREGDEN